MLRIKLQLFGETDPNNGQQAGTGEGSNGESQQGNNAEGGTGNTEGNGAEEGGSQQNSSLPKTQEEFNRVMQERLARERKKIIAEQQAQQSQQKPQQTTETQAQNGNNAFENLLMRAQLKAYEDGKFNSKAVKDAVVLAAHEAQTKGEVTEESIGEALESVLKRNPEWAKKTETEKGAGFRVGADGTEGTGSSENNVFVPKKSWNRHK